MVRKTVSKMKKISLNLIQVWETRRMVDEGEGDGSGATFDGKYVVEEEILAWRLGSLRQKENKRTYAKRA
jgi:hypothetical protein